MNERTLLASRSAEEPPAAGANEFSDVDLLGGSSSGGAAEKEPDSPPAASDVDTKTERSATSAVAIGSGGSSTSRLICGPVVTSRLELAFLSADRFALPSQSPFEVSIACPVSVTVGSPFDVLITIAVLSGAAIGSSFVDLQLSIGSDGNGTGGGESDKLSLSGLRAAAIRLLPHSKHTIAYKYVPRRRPRTILYCYHCIWSESFGLWFVVVGCRLVALECGVIALPRWTIRTAATPPPAATGPAPGSLAALTSPTSAASAAAPTGSLPGGALIVDPNDFGFVTVLPRRVQTS